METNKLKIWLYFTKFILGTFILDTLTILVDNSFNKKELEIK